MATQRFLVQSILGSSPGVALGHYRPLNIKQGGEKIRNPKFDQHSQHILNIKDSSKGWFNKSVTYCSDLVASHGYTMMGFAKAQIVVMPSSQKGRVSAGLEQIARNLCKADRRFVYLPGTLVRTKTIEKLARGGDRSLHVHLDSLEYRPRDGEPYRKIILDDVCTSTHSLGGAIAVMHQVLSGFEVSSLVLGKTFYD
ncbi:hypothetical protein [Variovorax paradoxus]|uniref:hypothetical protein n=1 Tax=Variovorax paradoxus TaxID=34073 RepID=UPI003ECEDB10